MTPFYVWLRDDDPVLWTVVEKSGYAADEKFLHRETDRLNVWLFFSRYGAPREHVLDTWRRYVRAIKEAA